MFTQHKPVCLWGINPLGKFNECISFLISGRWVWSISFTCFTAIEVHLVKSIGNALSQRGNFYIIYNTSNSAESGSNCWIALIPYLKGFYWELWKWINQWPLADIQSIIVNSNCSYLISNSLFFSARISSWSFIFLFQTFFSSLIPLGVWTVRFISSDRPVPACSLPAFWLVSVLRGMRNIYACSFSSPLAWNDL